MNDFVLLLAHPFSAVAIVVAIAVLAVVVVVAARRATGRRRSAVREGEPPENGQAWSHPIPAARSMYGGDSDFDRRVRAAFQAGRDAYGWRTIADMQLHGVVDLVESLEREFNDGDRFAAASLSR